MWETEQKVCLRTALNDKKFDKWLKKNCLPFVWTNCVCMPDLIGHTFSPEHQDQLEIWKKVLGSNEGVGTKMHTFIGWWKDLISCSRSAQQADVEKLTACYSGMNMEPDCAGESISIWSNSCKTDRNQTTQLFGFDCSFTVNESTVMILKRLHYLDSLHVYIAAKC